MVMIHVTLNRTGGPCKSITFLLKTAAFTKIQSEDDVHGLLLIVVVVFVVVERENFLEKT